MNRFMLASVLLVAVGALGAHAAQAAGAGGVTGPAFYVDGDLYRTVNTPTDLSGTRAPAHSWDVIYDFAGLQRNVATAARGDRDYNGGRWQVHALSFSNYAGALADNAVDANNNNVLDNDTEVMAAIQMGYAADLGIVKWFVCPAIPLPGNA